MPGKYLVRLSLTKSNDISNCEDLVSLGLGNILV